MQCPKAFRLLLGDVASCGSPRQLEEISEGSRLRVSHVAGIGVDNKECLSVLLDPIPSRAVWWIDWSFRKDVAKVDIRPLPHPGQGRIMGALIRVVVAGDNQNPLHRAEFQAKALAVVVNGVQQKCSCLIQTIDVSEVRDIS